MDSLKSIVFDKTRDADVFISYAKEDEKKVAEWTANFNSLSIHDKINIFVDKTISPGDNWQKEIVTRIEQAKLIVYFFSNNFFGSKDINEHQASYLQSDTKINFVILLSDCDVPNNYNHVKSFTSEIDNRTLKRYDQCTKFSQKETFRKESILEIRALLNPKEETQSPTDEPIDEETEQSIQRLQKESSPTKRLLMITCDKGAVGKTILSRSFANLYTKVFNHPNGPDYAFLSSRRVLFYDVNNVNADTYRYLYPPNEKDDNVQTDSVLIKPIQKNSSDEVLMAVAKDKARASEKRWRENLNHGAFWYKIRDLFKIDYGFTDIIVDSNHHPLNFEDQFSAVNEAFNDIDLEIYILHVWSYSGIVSSDDDLHITLLDELIQNIKKFITPKVSLIHCLNPSALIDASNMGFYVTQITQEAVNGLDELDRFRTFLMKGENFDNKYRGTIDTYYTLLQRNFDAIRKSVKDVMENQQQYLYHIVDEHQNASNFVKTLIKNKIVTPDEGMYWKQPNLGDLPSNILVVQYFLHKLRYYTERDIDIDNELGQIADNVLQFLKNLEQYKINWFNPQDQKV